MIKFSDIFDHIYKNKISCNKYLGQNYLISENVASKMASLLNIEEDDLVFEAGSGYGSVSFFLSKYLCRKIVLNDIDEKSTSFLKKIFKNIDVIQESYLNIDINKYTKIISSIPYYITTKTIEYFFINGINVKKYVFLVQKDFLKRLKSNVGSKDYGPLSIIIKNFFLLREEFDVTKNSFLPVPHVKSSVFSILTKKKNINLDRKKYLFFLKKMFFNRRKNIYKNLFSYTNNKEMTINILKQNNLSAFLRPEQIESDVYLNIFRMTL